MHKQLNTQPTFHSTKKKTNYIIESYCPSIIIGSLPAFLLRIVVALRNKPATTDAETDRRADGPSLRIITGCGRDMRRCGLGNASLRQFEIIQQFWSIKDIRFNLHARQELYYSIISGEGKLFRALKSVMFCEMCLINPSIRNSVRIFYPGRISLW